jgi:hypothetical protein
VLTRWGWCWEMAVLGGPGASSSAACVSDVRQYPLMDMDHEAAQGGRVMRPRGPWGSDLSSSSSSTSVGSYLAGRSSRAGGFYDENKDRDNSSDEVSQATHDAAAQISEGSLKFIIIVRGSRGSD